MEESQKKEIDIDNIPATNLNKGKEAGEKSGFAIPTDFVSLPSMGKVYPPTSALHKKEQVQIRHLTAADEDILTSRSLLRTGKAVDVLLQNCIIDKNIKVDELLTGDKNAILTYLRVTGYGPDYEVNLSCPSCSEEKKNNFDLSKLEMNILSIRPVSDGENAFPFKMPSGVEIVFKFLNNSEEREINDVQEKIKKATNSPVDKNITTRLKASIISVNGSSDYKVINEYVDMMPVMDSRAIRKYMDDNNPDLIMKQDYTCTSCGYEEEVDIPVTVSFFWPDS